MINEAHIHGWTAVETKKQIDKLKAYFEDRPTVLNLYAGQDKPKYIRYLQMNADFEITTKLGTFQGKKGDYLFTDPSDGKAIVPYKIFQKIF